MASNRTPGTMKGMRFLRGTPFVIIFQARVGSTLLQTLLDSHPLITATGEPFTPPSGRDAEAQIAWARAYWRTGRGLGRRRVLGFKTQWADIADPDRFGRLVRQCRARIIRMYRRNAVKTAVSWVTGEERYRATGEWNRRVGEARLAPVHIDPAVLAESLAFVERHRREIEQFVESLAVPTLSVAYEDLLKRRQAVLQEACRFLGVRSRPLTSSLAKNTSDDLRHSVANFDQLRDRYRGTRYEAMFDEVVVPER